MSHIEAWACVALDVLRFAAYFGWIALMMLGDIVFKTEPEDDFAKTFGAILWVGALIWSLWICGKAAGYWS